MKVQRNFLPNQYDATGRHAINHNYLPQQFADCDEILKKIKQVVINGDFTLGREVDQLSSHEPGRSASTPGTRVREGHDEPCLFDL